MDPILTKPQGLKFGGLSFFLSNASTGGENRRDVEDSVHLPLPEGITVSLLTSNLKLSRTAGDFILYLFNLTTSTWEVVSNDTAFDVSTQTLSSNVRVSGQYGLFLENFIADVELEQLISETVGELLFPTFPAESAEHPGLSTRGNTSIVNEQDEFRRIHEANNLALQALDRVSEAVSRLLELNDPDILIETPDLTLELSTSTIESLSDQAHNVDTSPLPKVAFPNNTTIGDADPENVVVLTLTTFTQYPFASSSVFGKYGQVILDINSLW